MPAAMRFPSWLYMALKAGSPVTVGGSGYGKSSRVVNGDHPSTPSRSHFFGLPQQVPSVSPRRGPYVATPDVTCGALLSLRAPSKSSSFSLLGNLLVGCAVRERKRPGDLQGATSTEALRLERPCCSGGGFTNAVAHYNLCKMHSAIRMTPAMKAGVARSIWGIAELLAA